MEIEIPYIICHGSGNRFVMVDGVAHAEAMAQVDRAAFARAACQELWPSPLDGLLVVERQGGSYAMRMLNTDGSEAEMCGNGIRCVARLVGERYLSEERFLLLSGGRGYAISREEPIASALETFGVEIAIRLSAEDFPKGGERFLNQPIEELHPALRFSYLNLGNPHLVALVEQIDFALLEELGKRIKGLREWFPRGINLSFAQVQRRDRLFVATYERGVGLTNSCGTAMTASTTAAALLGAVESGHPIEVRNRGGMVRCRCRIFSEQISTQLVGNATYEAQGSLRYRAGQITDHRFELCTAEQRAYNQFLATLQN